ncbi:MAG TPA: 6-bladed beta-propeller [Candidatus Saccharicenans sp.]|nr:6-bladed beta-propeller [Candidatus Saccharicenans sp.]HNT00692.1 6-bladed beta-propeller [Candidatus Saccharicenans sp.]
MKRVALFLGFIFVLFSNDVFLNCYSSSKELQFKPLKVERLLTLGSDRSNEDFFKPRSFYVDKEGRIFILDSGNGRVQCFSGDGKFLFSFGRIGQGPGELSKDASKIKMLEDGRIYLIDNPQRRINVYSPEGKFLSSAKTSVYYDDLELVDGTYFLSSMILEKNHKPIHIARRLGEIEKATGLFIEPRPGLVKDISNLSMPEPFRQIYRNCNFTRLVSTPQKELIFSQLFPYHLVKYNSKGEIIKDVSGQTDFDTSAKISFSVDEKEISIQASDQASVFDLSVISDGSLLVPFVNPKRDIFFIDVYDSDLNLVDRFKMPNEIFDVKKGESIAQIHIDNLNNLYALVRSEEDFPRLVKFRLNLD